MVIIDETGKVTMDYFDFIRGKIAWDFIVHIERAGSFLKYAEAHPLMISYNTSKQTITGEKDK